MTGPQIDTLRRKFEFYDKNNDGFLDRSELTGALFKMTKAASHGEDSPTRTNTNDGEGDLGGDIGPPD